MTTVFTWISETDKRFFPDSRGEHVKAISGDHALNERFSFQVLLRQEGGVPLNIAVSAADVPEGWTVRVRRIGYVPVRHANTGAEDCPDEADIGRGLPGYVPDPLFESSSMLLPGNETHGFWMTVTPGEGAQPGKHLIRMKVNIDGMKPVLLKYTAVLYPVTLAPRKDFQITHWFYADSLSAQYRVKVFSEEFWPICEAYVRDYAEHGSNVLYVPLFTPPLDGVKLPSQLLGVTRAPDGKILLDWSQVHRWLDMALSCGITHFEWVHPFTQWGVQYAVRIYEGEQEREQLLFPDQTPATSPEYREFLTQVFRDLRALLEERNLCDVSYFHVSDEPHGDEHRANYTAARTMLKEIAPWMKTMDALTDITYGREHLTDLPIPSIKTAVSFIREGIDCWCYYCCGPRGGYLNRLLDTPLPKIRMHGFLFYRWPFGGFLHWGYNYWFRSQTRELIDVYTEQDGLRWPGWAYGDPCEVYPGTDGKPVDSLRWELFAESLQDYQLLQTLGISRNNPVFAKIRDFNDFPKDSRWRKRVRKQLLTGKITKD